MPEVADKREQRKEANNATIKECRLIKTRQDKQEKQRGKLVGKFALHFLFSFAAVCFVAGLVNLHAS